MYPTRSSDLTARIVFAPSSEGGRNGAAHSGPYRPQFFDGERDWDARYRFDPQVVSPGSEAFAEIWLMNPDDVIPKLRSGGTFWLREGTRAVATGTILSVAQRGTNA
jgi:hypothetical protein